ncbi:DUF255 domain-containing protein [Pelagicoccus enzymogenes]|uniref:DUF255 domain-containing protein n=1 Tax=Pelagicoccus enzymogenes TaxID=2773457 RepID=UPI0028100E0A|nr:DUF255 domain-containing protein [Pelagicoccus enzymogenes]MDQ8201010.1 DUF255 domain-containing protein [Pelagicoccus enzymogenes]
MSFYPKLLLACLLATLPHTLLGQSALWNAHQSDTVRWRQWKEETLQAAKKAELPLFFFVGHYGNSLARSMLHETFQNETIASTLNDTAIPVLVDTNESPELAAFLGQLAFQHFSANELPTCLWTDVNLAPLNGGGYFPPTDDWGGQGFLSVARNVSEQWQANREDYLAPAQGRLKKSLATQPLSSSQLGALPNAFPIETFAAKEAPSLSAVKLYNTARHARTLSPSAAQSQLEALHGFVERVARGAGFDSVDGGFFIGSNDTGWRLPLFQKSTSDQAYLLLALSELQEQDPKPEYRFLMELTADFVRQKLLKENGLALQYLDSFASGETPDMVEGSYYLIAGQQVETLSSEAAAAWGLSTSGNLDEDTDILGIYQGFNVPFAHSPETLSDQLASERDEIRELRSQKKFPLSDPSGYTATNALLVRALLRAAQATRENAFGETAQKLFENLLQANGQLSDKVLYNSDHRRVQATSHDYSQLLSACLDLHEHTGDPQFLDTASVILKTLQADSRFQSETLRQEIGIEGLRTAIYQDTALESPLALQLENLKRLEKLSPEILRVALSGLPQTWVEHPASLQSLVQFASQQAAEQ